MKWESIKKVMRFPEDWEPIDAWLLLLPFAINGLAFVIAYWKIHR